MTKLGAHASRIPVISLARALAQGGLDTGIGGNDRYEILRDAVQSLPAEIVSDREALLDQLTAREKSGGTAMAGGIVVPHPRYPAIIHGAKPFLRVCYFAEPIAYGSTPTELVSTLLLLVCPDQEQHLQLLGKLATALAEGDFRQLLTARSGQSRLIAHLRTMETAWSTSRSATSE